MGCIRSFYFKRNFGEIFVTDLCWELTVKLAKLCLLQILSCSCLLHWWKLKEKKVFRQLVKNLSLLLKRKLNTLQILVFMCAGPSASVFKGIKKDNGLLKPLVIQSCKIAWPGGCSPAQIFLLSFCGDIIKEIHQGYDSLTFHHYTLFISTVNLVIICLMRKVTDIAGVWKCICPCHQCIGRLTCTDYFSIICLSVCLSIHLPICLSVLL